MLAHLPIFPRVLYFLVLTKTSAVSKNEVSSPLKIVMVKQTQERYLRISQGKYL